jgi:hypothetical protein
MMIMIAIMAVMMVIMIITVIIVTKKIMLDNSEMLVVVRVMMRIPEGCRPCLC